MIVTKLHRSWTLAAALSLAAVGLSGCFDLVQDVTVGRDGTGTYHIALTSQGIVGEGLKTASIIDTTRNRARMTTSIVNGRVTRSADVAFASLGDLALSNETMGVTITHRDWFGLGATHAAFRCNFRVDEAKKSNPGSTMGRQLAQSILGDHFYSFSVTVPGSIERIAPLKIGDDTIQPSVTGDFYHGHTVTWRLPLADLMDAGALAFEVDYVAFGSFRDSRTRAA